MRGPRKKRAVRPVLMAVVVLLGLMLVLGPLLMRQFFSVRTISVQGNSYVPTAEVIAASGVRLGQSLFTVNPDRVAQGINGHRYLQYIGLFKHYVPPSITLTVEEDTPRAKMMWMGMLIILGEGGIVLERTAQIDIPLHVPEIIGMSLEGVTVGQPLAYAVAGQAESIDALLDEIDLQGILGDIAQINIASPDNLILLTEDGLQIILGDLDNLAVKIATTRDTLPRVRGMGSVRGGILNVSSGTTADYRRPPGQ